MCFENLARKLHWLLASLIGNLDDGFKDLHVLVRVDGAYIYYSLQ
jgi:hypothetical protein